MEAVSLVISAPVTRADIPALCERVRAALGHCEAEVVECDVGAIACPDAVTVEALARVQLTARRLGRRIVFRRACGELRSLLAFAGLRDVLPCEDASALEPGGEAEQREQGRRVQEEGDPGDRTV